MPENDNEVILIQQQLRLSDGKLAIALGVTRQTVRNWRIGCACPQFAKNALRWAIELRRLDPNNDNLPPQLKGSGQ
jgi:DNA-binding transcriptional regulator YiaG